MKAGAKMVTVRVGDAEVIIPLIDGDNSIAPTANEWATNDAD
jgi:hypothetical protein